MKATRKAIKQEYEELKKFHHKTLHELADAAQIIKSFEYLENRYRNEHELLENVMHEAEKVCEAQDTESFKKAKADLQEAIRQYKSIVRKDLDFYPSVKDSFSSHWHKSKTTHFPH
ncbi:hypothetical protein GWO43_04905 [candidate division KSB1 bacterium]|nr:hypothetical protein [candidate division KSB1 bacterium]NIR71423.1 hypothetical protein [candidate division KSB1 bacterium]NIS23344.1 hypothetical protein [candidate division KSB1 bacterium]NIT70235.1 hypothetical protein [candidate division KSB1 bacterium]NIU23958.1 hypothetical protein [candidate division KSB1 bacterium]